MSIKRAGLQGYDKPDTNSRVNNLAYLKRTIQTMASQKLNFVKKEDSQDIIEYMSLQQINYGLKHPAYKPLGGY